MHLLESPGIELRASVPQSTLVGVWSPDPARAEKLARAVTTSGCALEMLETDEALASAAYRKTIDVLVADADERLAAQRQFIRVPLILVEREGDRVDQRLASQAYAIVSVAEHASLVLDRFNEHRALAAQAAERHAPPTRCSRCARPFESLFGDPQAEERFVRFGAVTLCESCIGALRRLLRASDTSLIEADAA